MRKLLLIMKITTLLLIAVILHVSAATSLAQKVTLSEKNVALVDVFNKIRVQTGYDFVFSTETLENSRPVTIDVKNEELGNVLTQIFKGQNLEFSLNNKIVTVKPKEESLLDNLKNKIKDELAQVIVTGRVVDELGQPIVGVTVKVKNTTTATATDLKGAFSITAPDNNAILVFSYIGYETNELAAKDISNGQVITLVASVTNLREVSIDKGYYRERQELTTGDVTIVSGKTIEEQPVTDPIMALEGRVPGLLISQNTGMPGANENVRIRGMNSVAQGGDPLYIIDGVPFSSLSLSNGKIGGIPVGGGGVYAGKSGASGLSPFNAINPEDIENIEVLKDADATAIYGSRGANSVILITTKKGKAGTVRVNADLSQGAGQVTRMMKLMNTQQFLQVEHQAYANDGLAFPSIKTTPTDGNYSVNGLWDTTRNTNWQKALLDNTAHYTNAQLSISGGSEQTQFYVGSGFSRQTTVFPGNNTDDIKESLNFSINHSSVNKRFQFQFSGGYNYDDNTLPGGDPTSAALSLPPDAPALYLPNGNLNWQLYNGATTFFNPLAYALQTSEMMSKVVTGHMNLSYEIVSGLKLQTSLGYTDEVANTSNLRPSTATAPPGNLIASRRTNNFGTDERGNWIIEPEITYDRKIGRGKLNILLGGTLQQNTSDDKGYITSGYNSDALIANPANASTFIFGGETPTLYRYEALLARIGYTWDDKYLLNLTANRDGSSRFGPGRQWGNFGAIGAGWVFSKETFIANAAPWLSFGKLRGSYGVTGNDEIQDYQYLSTFTSPGSITYQNSTVLAPARLTNPFYGWETNKKLEAGIELGFLKDRISLTADYYRNRSDNQLVPYPLPFISGFTTLLVNLPAVVQNTGAEFSLHTVNMQSGGFRWTTDINLSIPSSKLIAYPGLATSSYAHAYIVGQSMFIQQLFTNTIVNPADGKYEWLSANGTYTENPNYPTDLHASQPTTPKYYGALGNSFAYKGFQLDVFFEFRKQQGINYFGFSGITGGNFGSPSSNQPVAIIGNTWTTPAQQAKYGILSTQGKADPNGDIFTSDFEVSDASFIRLKNVALSWTLPQLWQQAIHMQNARIYINAQNLLTITNYFGLDPETQNNGLPPLRMISFGIHSSF